jgi:hypothetical protein
LALSAALGGFLTSYLFPLQYTAASTVRVEDHFVVIQVIPAYFSESVQTLSRNILVPSRLRPVIHALKLVKLEDEDELIIDIQQHTKFHSVITTASHRVSSSCQPVLGLDIKYTDPNAFRAQRICNVLASLIADENLRVGPLVYNTTDFLDRQLKLAKDDLEHKRGQLRAISKSSSPRSSKEEASHKALVLDYANARALYKALLAKTNTSELGVGGDIQRPLGDDLRIVTADLPQTPSFPNRFLFFLFGLGAGLLFGIGRLVWLPFPNVNEIEQLS